MKEFFQDVDDMAKRLKKDHKVDTSTSELIVNYLFQIEAHGGLIFDKHLTSWRAHKPDDDPKAE